MNCSSIKTLGNFQKPDVTLADYRISDLNLREVELTFDVEVSNPNPLAIDLASYTYEFDIEGNSFLRGNQTSNSQIAANGTQILQIPLRMSYSQLYQSVRSVVSQDEVSYTFGADLSVKVPVLGLIKIPVEQTGTLPVVKLPKISPAGLKVTNLSFTKADLELEFNVENPNGFGIDIDALNYEISINGLSSFAGQINESLHISKKANGSIKVPISINLAQLGMSAYQAIANGDDFKYQLNGSAEVGSDLPIFKNSLFDFDKSGVLNILK